MSLLLVQSGNKNFIGTAPFEVVSRYYTTHSHDRFDVTLNDPFEVSPEGLLLIIGDISVMQWNIVGAEGHTALSHDSILGKKYFKRVKEVKEIRLTTYTTALAQKTL